jgi:hypothetical protein
MPNMDDYEVLKEMIEGQLDRDKWHSYAVEDYQRLEEGFFNYLLSLMIASAVRLLIVVIVWTSLNSLLRASGRESFLMTVSLTIPLALYTAFETLNFQLHYFEAKRAVHFAEEEKKMWERN